MKRLILALAVLTVVVSTPCAAQSVPKSALDGLQLDGVDSDAALKTAGWTRQRWLETSPASQVKEYWRAWDCKGKPCDSKWQANIRAKAALIPRTDKDPKPSADTAAMGH